MATYIITIINVRIHKSTWIGVMEKCSRWHVECVSDSDATGHYYIYEYILYVYRIANYCPHMNAYMIPYPTSVNIIPPDLCRFNKRSFASRPFDSTKPYYIAVWPRLEKPFSKVSTNYMSSIWDRLLARTHTHHTAFECAMVIHIARLEPFHPASALSQQHTYVNTS